jgi:RHS repeat-associated protein
MQNDITAMTRTGSNWLQKLRAAGAALIASLACTLALAQVTITSPASGDVVYTDTVDVSGAFTGTNLTVISVFNGVNSTVLSSPRATGATTYTAPAVPIFPGSNTLTVTALQRDGTSTTSAVTITHPYLGVVMTSPLKGTTYTSPPTSLTLQASAMAMPANVLRVEYRLLTGTLIGTATTAPYTYVWNSPPSQSFTVFARMFDSAGRSTDSSGIPVTITVPNQPPVVSLTAPVNGATYTAPANITLQASASDPDGTVSLVEFFNNGNLLGATNTSPYSFALTAQPAGSYSFTARATDNLGAKTTSAPVSVTVNAITPPTVSLTSPVAGSSYLVPANIQVSADASTTAGTITKVDFAATRSGATPVTATVTTPPYTATLPITVGGTYTITATATGSNGGTATSSPLTVSVSDGVTYLHNDFAGSPMAATDSTGAVVWKENYNPYGSRNVNASAEAGNRVSFHAKPLDQETGLSYFGARYYDPVLGRFMGTDSARFSAGNLHSFNRYAYGNNNPYRYVDPDGRMAISWAVLVGLGAGAVHYAMAPPQQQAAMKESLTRLGQAVHDAVQSGWNLVFNEESAEGEKKVPNPNGRKGGAEHQAVVDEVEADIEARGLKPEREVHVRTPGGDKENRFADVGARDANGDLVELHQVGKEKKNGEPISREQKAINDINRATGLDTQFHPYNR